MTSEEIPVILSCDDAFVRHAACTVISIVRNSKRRYRFYILDSGISEANKAKLAAWDLGENTIQILPMQKIEAFESIAKLGGYFPPANFYRILIPDLFPKLGKAIYLDSDIVVVGDLGELWDIDLGNKLMGVVYMEPDFAPASENDEIKRRYHIPLERRYFNNGMLLMNLEALRKWDFATKLTNLIIEFIGENENKQLVTPCEILFNQAFDSAQLLELNPKFNFTVSCIYAKRLRKHVQPICWHYTLYKPWTLTERAFNGCTFFTFCTFKHYYKYAKQTPWRRERYKDIRWPVVVKMLWKWCFQPMEVWVKTRVLKRVQ